MVHILARLLKVKGEYFVWGVHADHLNDISYTKCLMVEYLGKVHFYYSRDLFAG